MDTFEITEIRLSAPDPLPRGMGFRFAHLSDLHLRRWETEHDDLIETLNARKLDFIFITGDFVSQLRPETLETLARLLGELRTERGIYGVRGNWEVLHAPPARALCDIFQHAGAELLMNESRPLSVPGGQLCVAGLDDLCIGTPDFRMATRGCEDADYSVLLAHAPLAARLLSPSCPVDLVLSGHTHGGQIRLPGIWRLFLPHWHGGLVEGLYELPHTRVYVNRGFGSVGLLPLRFRCPPEVAVFEI
jgi:hypothetical protein